VLEYAGKQRSMRAAPNTLWARGQDPEAREHLYLIWKYESGIWTEVARALATATEWSYELRPIARQLLAAANGHAGVDVLPSLTAAAARIREFLSQEFAELEPRDRARLAGIVHDYFAAQFVAVDQTELTM
jgi:hypothetical protein